MSHKPRAKEGYFPVPPTDSMQALRAEMVLTMESLGIKIEAQHHEGATGGQNEIDIRFTIPTLTADNLMIYKYVVKNNRPPARHDGDVHAQTAVRGQRLGNARHQSLWKGETNLFYDKGDYAELSKLGRLLYRRPLDPRQRYAGTPALAERTARPARENTIREKPQGSARFLLSCQLHKAIVGGHVAMQKGPVSLPGLSFPFER